MSVRPSVSVQLLGSHWKDYFEILYGGLLLKSGTEVT
jgi:hypothetical protein